MKFALMGAALFATAGALISPAAAQPVISNPGYCAQFYPNANCQNLGPGNPYTGSYQAGNWNGSYARMGHRMHRHSMRYRGMSHRHMH